MQKPTLIVLFLALVTAIAAAVLLPQLLSEPEAPMMRWTEDDEVEGSAEAEPETADVESTAFERSEAAPLAAAPADPEDRVQATLRGRVINKFRTPVAGAKVWLEFGRSGQRGGRGGRNRPRRIPDPVETDAEGRFAFQGQTFRNLRVSLQVQHQSHALGLFDKDVGEIEAVSSGTASAEVELGDLVLKTGGLARGRVTDLDGNGVPSAEITLQPDGRNRLRWQRNREQLLPARLTDANGYYSYPNMPDGDYTITATAKMHTEGRSERFASTEDATVEVADIQLGPGYEITGFVRTRLGEPIAKADVVLRSSRNRARNDRGRQNGGPERRGQDSGGRQRGGRGSVNTRGRDHRTKTDELGRFFLEHLSGAEAELRVDADGFLDYREDGIDPKLGQLINVAMEQGLHITGLVQDPSSEPVTKYAVRAVRLRALPDPSLANLDINEIMTKMRAGNLDEATRNLLRSQIQQLREQGGGGRDRGGRDRGGRGGRGGRQGGDIGKADPHPDGTFVADGLQEGVYEVHIQAPDHARFKSAEIEVRIAAPAPNLKVTVDPGVYVAGIVVDEHGEPIAGAQVELRSDSSRQTPAASNGRGNTPDWGSMARNWARTAAGINTRLETETDDEGLFFIKHAQRGTYRLSASARSFTNTSSEPFDLQADLQGFELRLGLLGSLMGTVSGMLPGDIGEAQVGAVMIPEGGGFNFGGMFGRGGRGGGRSFRTVEVGIDGSYRIDDLKPGNYVVRSWLGSAQQLMRELGPELLIGELQPDINVPGGDATRFDLLLTRPQVGVVAGSVMHNGENASGFRVELRQKDNGDSQPAAEGGRGGRGGRMARFMGRRTLQATVSASGRFSIKDVPAGLYDLTVTASRRGGALLEEPIQVLADVTLERSYNLTTGSLSGTITVDDGSDPKELGGRVSLLPNQITVPDNLNGWLRQNNSYDARLRDGSFTIESIPPGSYLLVLQPRNREPTSQQIVVQGELTVSVMAGKPAAPGTGGTRGAGRGARGSGAGTPATRGQGGGNRGGRR